MGAIAEGLVAYAQPLLDQTDGSIDEMNKAFAVSNLCYNLAILPEESREKVLAEAQSKMGMDDEEFEEFRLGVIVPMIRRHEDMFPLMHGRTYAGRIPGGFPQRSFSREAISDRKFAGTEPYAPCPCNSGKKYKFCCGSKSR